MNPFQPQFETDIPSASQQALRVLKPTVLAVAMGCVGSAWAVEGGVVVNGTGNIATAGATTTVSQSTDKMVVNWKNFDIAQGQTVKFAQPTASSAVLNRVTGPVKASDIQGTLTANGRVYVVNPAGVMFGSTAVVNADSIVASTMNIDDRQFMAGGRVMGNQKVLDLASGESNATVQNLGTINARQVALLGGKVINKGTINATGDVTLGAADTATLTLNDSGFSVALGKAELDAMVENGGLIVAKGGNVMLNAAAAGDAVGNAVRSTGTIEAHRATTGAGGSIELRSNADGQINVGGKLTADNQIMVHSERNMSPNKGADIVVDSLAQLKASDVFINAVGTLTSNGSYTADSLMLSGDTTVINAPVVNARDVRVHANNGLTQNADIAGDHVSLMGTRIEQAANVTTHGGTIDLVTHQDAGTVNASTLTGGNVHITGNKVTFNGDVNGTYGIEVTTGGSSAGTITALKSLTSDMGAISLDASRPYGAGKVVTRGVVNGDRVNLAADTVEVYGPVTGNNDVFLSGGAGGVYQEGNVTSSHGSVVEQGGAIRHAAGATTTAAQLAEFRSNMGDVPGSVDLRDIKAGQVVVDVDAGSVNLNGEVSGDQGVQVTLRKGSITATKAVESANGMVGLSATDLTVNGAINAAQGVYLGSEEGSMALHGPVNSAGNVQLSAGKDITLDGDVSGMFGIDARANLSGTGGTITASKSLKSEMGDVYLDAMGNRWNGTAATPGKVVTRGAVDGNRVNLMADALEVHGPVTGNGDVILTGGTSLLQEGNVTSIGGSVTEEGAAIHHAAGATTTAAQRAEFRTYPVGMPLAFNLGDIKAAQVIVENAGGAVNLNGAVSADDGVQVMAGNGSITAAKAVESKYGWVNLNAIDVTANGAIDAQGVFIDARDGSITLAGPVRSASEVQLSAGKTITQKGDIGAQGSVAMNAARIDQAATSTTTAQNAYLQASTINSGVITASNDVTLQGDDVTLGGTLTGRNVNVPANAKNTAGNIVVTEPQPYPYPYPYPQPEPQPYPQPEPYPYPQPEPYPQPYWQTQVQVVVQSDTEQRPAPYPVEPDPGPRPAPYPVEPDPGPRPAPYPVEPDPGPRPYVQSNLMVAAADERPYPVTESPDPGPRPAPYPVQPDPGPRPAPYPVAPDPGPRPY